MDLDIDEILPPISKKGMSKIKIYIILLIALHAPRARPEEAGRAKIIHPVSYKKCRKNFDYSVFFFFCFLYKRLDVQRQGQGGSSMRSKSENLF